jgi:hypothetical protein
MKLIAAALLLTTTTSAIAQVHTLENNPTMQAQLELKWEKTHPMNNQFDDHRSFAEKYPHADPKSNFHCDISHNDATNINTLSNCHN